MRKMFLGFAAALLASCLSPDEDPPHAPAFLGAFQGNHGAITRIRGIESEMILNADGTYRYFLIDSNTATYTSKGKWKTTDREMVWTEIARSNFYHGAFRTWDTLAAPDTSYLRNVSDTGFERLEASWDAQLMPKVQWVQYRQIRPADPLPEGNFAYSETYRDGVDTTVTDTAAMRLHIKRGGPYIQQNFLNGVLASSDVDSQWTQAGTFLITSRNRYCSYDSASTNCGDSPFDFEYVARLEHIGDTLFHLWIPPGTTYQADPFWAAFRKAP